MKTIKNIRLLILFFIISNLILVAQIVPYKLLYPEVSLLNQNDIYKKYTDVIPQPNFVLNEIIHSELVNNNWSILNRTIYKYDRNILSESIYQTYLQNNDSSYFEDRIITTF